MNESAEARNGRAESAATVHGARGLFHDVDRLNRAVSRLTWRSVPVDEIHVYALGSNGEPERELVVEDEAGTLGGALFGAIIGAILGVLLVALARSGAFGELNGAIYGLGTPQGALRLIVVLALVGVPVGGILNMGHWNARKKVSSDEIRGTSFLVVVETEELAELARKVLVESGAEMTGQSRAGTGGAP